MNVQAILLQVYLLHYFYCLTISPERPTSSQQSFHTSKKKKKKKTKKKTYKQDIFEMKFLF